MSNSSSSCLTPSLPGTQSNDRAPLRAAPVAQSAHPIVDQIACRLEQPQTRLEPLRLRPSEPVDHFVASIVDLAEANPLSLEKLADRNGVFFSQFSVPVLDRA
jgi:hypothetical protein